MTKKSEQYAQRITQLDLRIAEMQKQKRLLEEKRKEALDQEFLREVQHLDMDREDLLRLIRERMEGAKKE